MLGIYLLAALVAAALGAGALLFNQLVRRRQLADNGWADIDVQLKRRADLVPQLVTAVKAYAAHEKSLFEDVVEKRARALEAGADVDARGRTETALSAPLARLIAVAEAYPDLKASENFLGLQTELAETEDKIEMARRFYNGAVRELNTAVESVPSNMVAGLFGFGARAYFEIKTAEAEVPAVALGSGA